MRLLKIFVGIAVAVVALFVIVSEQLAGVSADAVVNARLTTLRAPIAGRLQLGQRELGSLVETGEALGALSDPLVDDIRLNDLVLERQISAGEAQRLADEIAAIDEAIIALETRKARYSTERIRQLEARVSEREAQSRALQASLDEASAAFARATQLRDRGVETVAALERARAATRVSERRLDAANEEISVAAIELASAREGVFLGEGYNDAPYSEQRISELTVEQERLKARQVQETTRAASIELRIDAERLRVNRLASAEVTANARARVWEFLAADGERLQRGQDILRLVNCSSAIVTLSVSESVYNTLKVGQNATFRLSGESRAFDGTILRLAGSGAATVYQNLAVAPSGRHLQRFDVALKVPGLLKADGLDCVIGRTGRVFFEGRPLDGLRRILG